MRRILVVEEDMQISRTLRDYLEVAGYDVTVVGDGSAAIASFRGDHPDLMVLDLGLPSVDGLDVAREVRRASTMPIIMLTARGEESDRIVGLELGADDYLTKPFSPRELAVRVRNLLRRTTSRAEAEAQRIEFGDVAIDAAAREVRKGGEPLKLTLKEFDLLLFFASHPRRVFSRDQLMDRVWGYRSALDTGTITVHIRRLRTKIEDDPSRPRHLETVFGAGYRFTP